MDGLEAVETDYSHIGTDNEKYRFDSEFYKKNYQHAYAVVKRKAYVNIGEILETLTDFHANGSYESIAQHFALLDEPDFAYMVRSTDLEKSDFESDVKYVSEDCYNFLSKSKVFGGELLINKIGSPGRTYLMPKLEKPVSLGMNLFMIRLKDNSPVTNTYAWLFFNTELGKRIIERKINGTVPLTIDKEAIRTLPIPIIKMELQERIKKVISDSENMLKNSKSVYTTAETHLLTALGMDNFTPSNEPVAIKSFAESFGVSGRLDAEYYQRKYEDIENTIILGDTVNCRVSYGEFEPHNGEYKYIELSNIGTAGNITGHTTALFDELPSRARRLTKSGQLIVSSIEGSLESCAIISNEYDGAICSTGFYIIDSPEMNSETLLVLFKSAPIQALMKKRCSGTILTALSKSALEQMPLPKIDTDIQQQIAADVQRSFELRRKSERLLDVAKRTVEIAIENGEDVAMSWLERKLFAELLETI